jgi:hypothetical protein
MKQSIHQPAKARPTLKSVNRTPAPAVGAGLPAIPRTPPRHAIAGKPAPTGRFNHPRNTPGWMSAISFDQPVKHGCKTMDYHE